MTKQAAGRKSNRTPKIKTEGASCRLSPGQQRVLELQDGESFLLQTLALADGGQSITPWRYRTASEIAVRLAGWAQARQVLIVHRRLDQRTVRIWRLGAI